MSDDAQAVIVEVSKAVSAALNELHLSVEALGDAVIFCKAPHGDESVSPEEVVLEGADDMEPIGDDASMGEPSPSQGSVRTGEVHADHLHLLPAFERGEEPSQLGLATPRDKVKNPVITQVAKCRGERHAAMDAMFVDPEDAGTLQTLTFTGLARGELRINASYACVA